MNITPAIVTSPVVVVTSWLFAMVKVSITIASYFGNVTTCLSILTQVKFTAFFFLISRNS